MLGYLPQVIDAVSKLKTNIVLVFIGSGFIGLSAMNSLPWVTLNPSMTEKLFMVGCFIVAYGMFHKPTKSPFLDDMMLKIEEIRSELRTNGGKSTKDVVLRTAAKLDVLDNRQLALMDNHGSPIFETDTQGAWNFVNRALINLVERPTQDLLGHGWLVCVDASMRGAVASEWQSAVAEQRRFEMTVLMTTPRGTEIPIWVQAQPVKTPHGVSGWFGQAEIRNDERRAH